MFLGICGICGIICCLICIAIILVSPIFFCTRSHRLFLGPGSDGSMAGLHVSSSSWKIVPPSGLGTMLATAATGLALRGEVTLDMGAHCFSCSPRHAAVFRIQGTKWLTLFQSTSEVSWVVFSTLPSRQLNPPPVKVPGSYILDMNLPI